MNRLPRVAITQGDTNGIGYELILKTLAEPEILELFTPVIYGTRMIANVYAEMFGIDCRLNPASTAEDIQDGRINIVEVSNESVPVKTGTPTPESAMMAAKAMSKALEDYGKGWFDVLVVAPSAKDDLHKLMEKLKVEKTEEVTTETEEEPKKTTYEPVEIIKNDNVCVASILKKVNDANALDAITEESIIACATNLRNNLRRDLDINNPRIAVLSFGDSIDESEGSKDKSIIAAATEKLRTAGVNAFGPYTAKSMFEESGFVHFDCILGIHADQVITPLQSIYGESCVRLISAMPLVATAPIQGASFDIAGQGIADETSMRMAVYTAIDTQRIRTNYDLPLRNPLKKIYHERREDGEKARFSVKREFKPREDRGHSGKPNEVPTKEN